MKITTKFCTWVYVKNWQFDRMYPMKRDVVFFSIVICLIVINGLIPAVAMVMGKDSLSALGIIFTMLSIGGASLFRFPYIGGKLNRYAPEYAKKPRVNAPVQDWKLQYLRELGLMSGANAEDIKKAYRKLAMKYHPDRVTANEEKFKSIKSAYEKLQ